MPLLLLLPCLLILLLPPPPPPPLPPPPSLSSSTSKFFFFFFFFFLLLLFLLLLLLLFVRSFFLSSSSSIHPSWLTATNLAVDCRLPLVPCILFCSVVTAVYRSSLASEGFGSPAGCAVLAAVKCCYLCPPVLPQPMSGSAVLQYVFLADRSAVLSPLSTRILQPMSVSAVLQDLLYSLLGSVIASVHQPSSANERFGSPAGSAVLNAVQCGYVASVHQSLPCGRELRKSEGKDGSVGVSLLRWVRKFL